MICINFCCCINIQNHVGFVYSDVEYYNSSRFSFLLRNCEEALKLVEKDRKTKNQSNNKDKLLDAFKELENFMKHFLKSLDEQPKGKKTNII